MLIFTKWWPLSFGPFFSGILREIAAVYVKILDALNTSSCFGAFSLGVCSQWLNRKVVCLFLVKVQFLCLSPAAFRLNVQKSCKLIHFSARLEHWKRLVQKTYGKHFVMTKAKNVFAIQIPGRRLRLATRPLFSLHCIFHTSLLLVYEKECDNWYTEKKCVNVRMLGTRPAKEILECGPIVIKPGQNQHLSSSFRKSIPLSLFPLSTAVLPRLSPRDISFSRSVQSNWRRECFGHRCNRREVLGDIVWRSCLQLNYVPLAVTYSVWKKERKQKWHWINVRPHHREPFKEAWVMLAVHWCPRASMPEVLVCAGRDGLFVPELVYNFSWNFFLCHCESAACVCFLTIPRLACVLHFLKLSRRALQFQAMPLGRRLLQTGWNHGSCANELV